MIDLIINEIKKDKATVSKFIADNSKLKQGIYLKVNIDEPFDKSTFKDFFIVDGKDNDISKYICDLPISDRLELIDYVKSRDVISGLLNDDTNKTIDGNSKKILSSTYQTLCVSNKFLVFPNAKIKNAEEFIQIINSKGFDSLLSINSKIEDSLRLKSLKFKDEKLQSEIESAKSEFRINQIKLIKEYIKSNFEAIVEFVLGEHFSNADKTKIFFYSKTNKIDDSIESYNREYTYYLLNYIFNKNTTDLIDNKVKGCISFGFNNNEEKPYLIPKRMNIDSVKKYSFEEALDTMLTYSLLNIIYSNKGSKLFGFESLCKNDLFSCSLDNFINLNNKTLFFKMVFHKQNTKIYIGEYDLTSERATNRDPNAFKKIKCIDFLNTSTDFSKKISPKDKLKTKFNIKELLSFMLHSEIDCLNKYGTYIPYGLNSSIKGAKTLENKNDILFEKYKFMLHEFLTNSVVSEELINIIITQFTKECIDIYFNTMFMSDYFAFNLAKLLNIKLNLLNRYRKEHILLNILNHSKTKLFDLKAGKIIKIENDSEFYFILGQLTYYIESQSKGNVDFGIFKFYTEKRHIKYIKSYLIQRFELYSYNINLNHQLFKNIFDLVLSYSPTTDIVEHSEEFYIGICCENVFYKNIDNQKNDNN